MTDHISGAKEAVSLTPLQRAFIALEEAEARAQALEDAAREPIAIIGIACRVPGGGDTPDQFWKLMHDGVDATGPVPADRWAHADFYDTSVDAPGKIATNAGGFLNSVDLFDPAFFGIAPREAASMDPQQRLLLEVAWEALEHAAQPADQLEKSFTGVFVGVCGNDYAQMQLQTGDRSLLDAHFTSGIAHSIASGRLSYLLGLQGPSLTLDTACSSSLVAVHVACQALRNRECSMAISGGVNLILSPELFIALSHSHMLAPDGRCKTFDAAADGFARGEGCGVVILKRLSDAQNDGDRILAVVRGSAVNQDGPSSSLTAPNGPQQEAVIRSALSRAGVEPRQVSFVEAHGTGTQLGDPLEVQALGSVFSENRDARTPLLIGSVKTNVGHLEGAAGIVGLIKLVLSLQHKTIPAHINFHTPSPHIPWNDLPIRVQNTTSAWNPIDGRRIAGVSSFGFSGTNAHVIVEEAPVVLSVSARNADVIHLLPLSAKSDHALKQLAREYADVVVKLSDTELTDICATASTGRAQFDHRATIICRTTTQLRAQLQALASNVDAPGVRKAVVPRRDPPRVAFLFTGQGSQYSGMTRELYEHAPVFRAAVDRCAEIAANFMNVSLLDLLYGDGNSEGAIDQTAHTQPALFAVEYALTELWRSLGIVPIAAIGHSIGEYVAACIAGVMTLEDALRIVIKRGQLMQSLPTDGAMTAIQATQQRVQNAIGSRSRYVSIAAINSPDQCVISGSAEHVRVIVAELEAQGVRCTTLPVSHAFHSPLVEPILPELAQALRNVAINAPSIRVVSNVTGDFASRELFANPEYWTTHARNAVKLSDGLQTIAELRPDCLVEIGPQPTLLSFAKATLTATTPQLIPTLRKGRADWEQMLDAVSSLYLSGATINWHALYPANDARVIDLPFYPFERTRHWFASNIEPNVFTRAENLRGHPVLGTRVRSAARNIVFESQVGVDKPAFVREHVVQGRPIMPATAFTEAFASAAAAIFKSRQVAIENITIDEALSFDEQVGVRILQVVCEERNDGSIHATLNSQGASASVDDTWQTHATALFRSADTVAFNSHALSDARARCTNDINVVEFYQSFAERGLTFGDALRTVESATMGNDEVVGKIKLNSASAAESSQYLVHPLLLDGCLQLVANVVGRDDAAALFLPIGVGSFVVHATNSAPTTCVGHAQVMARGTQLCRANISVFADNGVLIAEMLDVQLKRVAGNALDASSDAWFAANTYELNWRPAVLDRSDVSIATVTHNARALHNELFNKSGMRNYNVFARELDSLCGEYVVNTFVRLGWNLTVGERFESASLAGQLRVAPHYTRLFERLVSILEELAIVSREGSAWRVVQPLPTVQPAQTLARLKREFPIGAAELEMTGRVAASIAEAMRGERDAIELLFPAGSLDTAEELYRDTPTARYYNEMLATVIADAATRATADKPLRILEVGAGTGGSTAHVIAHLPANAVQYTFTDVGPLFVEKARERFGANAYMKFVTLDIERHATTQGFAKASFDIIIASNVVHATASLKSTLENLRELLVPGGLFAMLEVTAPQRWFDLTVGLTPGWWAYTDTDLRPTYATLPRDSWTALLNDSGFEKSEALPLAQNAEGVLALQSLFVTRRALHDGKGEPKCYLMFADDNGTINELARSLRENGHRCILVQQGLYYAAPDSGSQGNTRDEFQLDPSDADQLPRVFDALKVAHVKVTDVVHGWSLNSAAWSAISENELEHAEQDGPISAMLVAQALLTHNLQARLWLITRGAQPADSRDRALSPTQAMTWGVGRSLQVEHSELNCVCVDLDPEDRSNELSLLFDILNDAESEPLLALRNSVGHVVRLDRLRTPTSESQKTAPRSPFGLQPSTHGSLNTFVRTPVERRLPSADEVEIEVHATGLNFKDVLNSLGAYPGDPGPLGGECAGRVVAVGANVSHLKVGDDVVAVASGSFASHVIARGAFTRLRPPNVSAEEGAAFPIAYLTAAYCLGHIAALRAGDRVLIHAAAGGVGMASVRIAQAIGATIYATAGSESKRELLRSIGVEHVFDSRKTRFANQILAHTNGDGVDVVLNSLSGEMLDASFSVLVNGGRFVEIGKRDIKTPAQVAAMSRGIRYSIIDWGDVGNQNPELIGGMLAGLVDALGSGALASLPRHVFDLSQVDRAFRMMADARHVGKIVVRHVATAMHSVRSDGTYLISGGLSGLGLETARWLVDRGAGRVVLISRKGVTAENEQQIHDLRTGNTVVIAEAVDVSDEVAMNDLLRQIRSSGPALRGVIHSAGVLRDSALLSMTTEQFAAVLQPKVGGAFVLDKLTRADALDWFVMFSSVASVIGSRGQSNHAAANSFMDVLAHERRARGLPGLSINWGAWSEIGSAAGADVVSRMELAGLGVISPERGIDAFAKLLQSQRTQASVLPANWDTLSKQVDQHLVQTLTTAKTRERQQVRAASPARDASKSSTDLHAMVESSAPARRRHVIAAFVSERALRALGMDVSRGIDPRVPLGEIGLDSLLAIELRNTLGNAIGQSLPATLLFDYPTVDALTDFLYSDVMKLGVAERAVAVGLESTRKDNLVGSIEDLSDDEVDRRLALRAQRKP